MNFFINVYWTFMSFKLIGSTIHRLTKQLRSSWLIWGFTNSSCKSIWSWSLVTSTINTYAQGSISWDVIQLRSHSQAISTEVQSCNDPNTLLIFSPGLKSRHNLLSVNYTSEYRIRVPSWSWETSTQIASKQTFWSCLQNVHSTVRHLKV